MSKEIINKEHPEKSRNAIHKYLINHRELCRKRNRQWRLNNPEKQKLSSKNWYRRTKNKITECLYNGMIQRIRCLRHQNAEIHRKDFWQILGYDYEDFIKHIEKQFQPGMTWDNHGEWHIDHIIPICFFHFQSSNDVEFKMCWRLENMQPMWKHEHHVKSNKILVA